VSQNSAAELRAAIPKEAELPVEMGVLEAVECRDEQVPGASSGAHDGAEHVGTRRLGCRARRPPVVGRWAEAGAEKAEEQSHRLEPFDNRTWPTHDVLLDGQQRDGTGDGAEHGGPEGSPADAEVGLLLLDGDVVRRVEAREPGLDVGRVDHRSYRRLGEFLEVPGEDLAQVGLLLLICMSNHCVQLPQAKRISPSPFKRGLCRDG
jgi:hypothetical protein